MSNIADDIRKTQEAINVSDEIEANLVASLSLIVKMQSIIDGIKSKIRDEIKIIQRIEDLIT